MFFNLKLKDYFFLSIFSLLPVTILIGPAISLINILLITLSFLVIFYKKLFFYILNERIIIILCILYSYLIFNTFISIDFESSFLRNFGFIRYIILFIAINFFFLNFENLKFIINFWIFVIFVVLFDVIFEAYNGYNILGFVSENKKRIVSFFKDQQVIGAFINGFVFVIIGFFFRNFDKKAKLQKVLIFSFVLVTLMCLILTGERSNTIKLFLGLIIFFYLNNKITFNYKIFFLFSGLCIFIFIITISGEVRHRYNNDIIIKLSNIEKRNNYIYFQLYKSGFEVFKRYPILGAGNKNYRVEACKESDDEDKKILCITHPHQIYLELLSEHGIIGTLIILIILFYLIFKNLKIILKKNNSIQIGCFSYLIVNFIPILPGGSFFADFNSNFFWINLSLLYASSPNTNVFKRLSN